MLFNSFVFLLAFPIIFAAYYLCPIKWRSWLLLLISYAVYMNWVPVYALILLWVTLTTYTGARYISRNSPKNKLKMTVAGILTLLPLLFFKYYNFINNIVYDILTPLHLRIEINTMHWAVPIGISFFSFQAYGYLADVYYRRIDCERNLRDYALFISFFPQIASGPISKAKDLADAAGKKTGELVSLTKLKMESIDTQKALSAALEKIGRTVYDARGAETQPELAELFATAEGLEARAAEIAAKIDELRRTKHCAACGKNNPADAAYCQACGEKL